MTRIVLVLLLVAGTAGCEFPQGRRGILTKERPTVNLPLTLRQRNWIGSQRQGSCTWASMVSLLRWQGHYAMADWIRRNCGDGEWVQSMAQQLDNAGIRYAYATNGDVRFLEWACNTRRGCAITVKGGAHMVCLVYLDSQWAALLDNNFVDAYIWVPRETLLSEWQASRGWAVTPVYSPTAPLPN